MESRVSLTRSTTSTTSSLSNVLLSSEWKLFGFDKIEVDDYWNIAAWCHVSSLTYLKADITLCATIFAANHGANCKTRIQSGPVVKRLSDLQSTHVRLFSECGRGWGRGYLNKHPLSSSNPHYTGVSVVFARPGARRHGSQPFSALWWQATKTLA